VNGTFERALIIAGAARSGTSWLGQILDSSPDVRFRFQPLFSYAFKDRLDYESTSEDIQEFLEDLYQSKDDFLLQTDKRTSGQYPVFKKNSSENLLVLKENRYQYLFTKILNNTKNVKFLGIIRNPCAVLSSWVKNPKEFPPGSKIQNEWRLGQCKNQGKEEEFFGYYKWKEIANLYLDLNDRWPKRVHIVRYEDLVADTNEQALRIFQFAELPSHPQMEEFLSECNQVIVDTPYSVFKSKDAKDRWRKDFPQNITDEIYADISGTRLEQFLI